MAPFNIDEYLSQDRSLYYEYDDICPSAPIESWAELFQVLGSIKSGNVENSKSYARLQSRFHKNLDSLSSSRAIDAILSVYKN